MNEENLFPVSAAFFLGDLLSGSIIFAIEKFNVLEDGEELFDEEDSVVIVVDLSDSIFPKQKRCSQKPLTSYISGTKKNN